LAIGEKLFEEMGKVAMVSVESADAMGVILKRSSNSEVIGSGRFPGGTNMGYGTLSVHHDGQSHGEWLGMIVTEDNETIVWKGSGDTKKNGEGWKGILVMTFMTKSEKYDWMNSVIAVSDLEGSMTGFRGVAYEWE
jgi:hypothetical protein